MVTDIDILVALVLLYAIAAVCWWRQPPRQSATPSVTTTVQRLLKPRSPDDCVACCQQPRRPPIAPPPAPAVQPWHEVKPRRGRPKRIATEGFACLTPTCPYYRITDAQIHALVGDGTHGKTERIQTLPCQACGVTFTTRRHTSLYRLKTTSQRIGLVLTALAEGLSVAAASRVFGHTEETITRWVTRAGEHSARLHHRWFQRLRLPHLQLDELRTRLRDRTHVLWLWVVVDPLSKLIPVLHLGARTQAGAHRVVHTLRQQLAPDCLPAFTSDGLNLYFYALTAHFGHWTEAVERCKRQWRVAPELLYGQVKKTYRRRKVVSVTRLMRCGTPEALRTALTQLGLTGRLNTAFVERVNLTLRRSMAALARRTWSTAQEAPHLLVQLEWWRGYYHFVRPHSALRMLLVQPRTRGGKRRPQLYRQRTPAMAAGLTSRCWTVCELLGHPLPPDVLAA
jgi:transposase-like protein